jgi:16S rRNA (uracil1498-N3)-methyltransferase
VSHRAFAPGIVAGADLTLPDAEAEHLTRVLRMTTGSDLEVFDGIGHAFAATIVRADRRGVVVRAGRAIAAAPETQVRIRLVMAVLKGDKMDTVIRDAAMLGVSAILPVVSQRSEVSLASVVRGHRVPRWTRIAVSAVKQCGRAAVPAIEVPVDLSAYWRQSLAADRLMLVEPSTHAKRAAIGDIPRPAAADVIVGPEGGWAAEETEAASNAGARVVTLGPRTLRADAAPLVALTALLTVWGEL